MFTKTTKASITYGSLDTAMQTLTIK